MVSGIMFSRLRARTRESTLEIAQKDESLHSYRSMTHLLTLYFLDSGAYSKGFIDWLGYFFPTEYDWIHQVALRPLDHLESIHVIHLYFRIKLTGSYKSPVRLSGLSGSLQSFNHHFTAAIDPIERPFVPDGAKDIGDLWGRQAADQVTPDTRRLAKPNALMFFHIPLCVSIACFFRVHLHSVSYREESYAAADINPNTGRPLDTGIHDIEENGSAKKQDGFFHKGLLQALESDHRAGGNAREVKVVSNGHCHSMCDKVVLTIGIRFDSFLLSYGKLPTCQWGLALLWWRRVSAAHCPDQIVILILLVIQALIPDTAKLVSIDDSDSMIYLTTERLSERTSVPRAMRFWTR